MHSWIYRENSTGDRFADSLAYGTEELGNPRVIHFYKQYKHHISLEMLKSYHHIHRYLSKKEIPNFILDTPLDYNGIPYNALHFSILDLDPAWIFMASDRETGATHWITQPSYIEELDDALIYVDREVLRSWAKYLLLYLSSTFWLDIKSRLALDNFRITWIDNWVLQITVTDIWSHIQEICIDNLDRINEKVPDRHNTKIQTRKDLKATLLGYTIIVDESNTR